MSENIQIQTGYCSNKNKSACIILHSGALVLFLIVSTIDVIVQRYNTNNLHTAAPPAQVSQTALKQRSGSTRGKREHPDEFSSYFTQHRSSHMSLTSCFVTLMDGGSTSRTLITKAWDTMSTNWNLMCTNSCWATVNRYLQPELLN